MFAVELRGFHQNAQTLTGNTIDSQILKIVIKYTLFGSVWQLVSELFKSISIPATASRLMTEKKFAKSERYKSNGKHFHTIKMSEMVQLQIQIQFY